MWANHYTRRAWMDKEKLEGPKRTLTREYGEEINEFMTLAKSQAIFWESGKLYCPCPICDNSQLLDENTVWYHLYRDDIKTTYKIWYYHGETDEYHIGSTSCNVPVILEESLILEESIMVEQNVGMVHMGNDVYMENMHLFSEGERRVDEPNAEARRFYYMLDSSNNPLYEGCRDDLSHLSTATRLMNIKTDFNLSEYCVDAVVDFVKDILLAENLAPASYYEIEKLVVGLGLTYQIIDVCISNCIIYWKTSAKELGCSYCGKARYQIIGGKVRVHFKRMLYLPITYRLKRLYQSASTAVTMRWHQEHSIEGEIAHPSDAEAWKHFQTNYPSFSFESRNVYLGLCTDGFNPFGKHGRQY